MSYYLLVEGRRTEMMVYPAWLNILAPNLKKATSVTEVTNKGDYYYIFSGLGMPHLLDRVLPSAIADVEANSAFTELVVVVDSEGISEEELSNEIYLRFEEFKIRKDIILTIIIQNICIETWLLANKKMYSANTQCEVLRGYREHHDCCVLDPEDMKATPKSLTAGSVSDFHFDYVRRIFREKNLVYTKRTPANVCERHYVNQIINRCISGHIASFNSFWNWVTRVRDRIDISR
jgi:hypothetical protein